MNEGSLRLHEICDLHDEHLLAWCDLFETCFPPEERPLVSVYLRLLQRKAAGLPVNSRLFTAVDARGQVVGMAQLRTFPEWQVEYMGYMAIAPSQRSQGSGSALYRLITELVRQEGARWLAFDVEIPEHMGSEESRRQAERRLCFYARLGAERFNAAHLRWGGSEMYWMVHPFGPVGQEELMQFFRQAAAEFGGEYLAAGGAETRAHLC